MWYLREKETEKLVVALSWKEAEKLLKTNGYLLLRYMWGGKILKKELTNKTTYAIIIIERDKKGIKDMTYILRNRETEEITAVFSWEEVEKLLATKEYLYLRCW